MKRACWIYLSTFALAIPSYGETSDKRVDPSQLRHLIYEPLEGGNWKMLHVGGNDQVLSLPFGRSYFAAVSLPAVAGTIELRMQTPAIPFGGIKSILACVTFLDANFQVTHTADHNEAYIPPPGAFRPLENPLLEMRVEKRPSDRYMLVHTDEKIVGQKLRYELGNRGATIIVTGKFAYSAQNPRSVEVTATAKGNVRVKLFPPKS